MASEPGISSEPIHAAGYLVFVLTDWVWCSKLGNNSLRGTIPSTLQLLSALEYLYLLDNPLMSGTIVSSILELSSMAHM